MVQLTSKFTTRVVFSRVLFKALIKTRVPHASEQIACEGLVHTSLDCVRSLHMCLYENYKSSYVTNRALAGLESAMTIHRCSKNAQTYRNSHSVYLPLSQPRCQYHWNN